MMAHSASISAMSLRDLLRKAGNLFLVLRGPRLGFEPPTQHRKVLMRPSIAQAANPVVRSVIGCARKRDVPGR